MLLYISNPPDLLWNVSGSSTTSFYLRRPPPLILSLSIRLQLLPPVSSLPSAATYPALILMIFRASCSHHLLNRRIPGFRSSAKHKSMIGRVAIYCATMFWRRAIYTPISSNPTIVSATPMSRYTHVPSRWRLGPMPAIRRAAWWWNSARVFPYQGVSTHVSDPKRSTACTTSTLKNPAVLLSPSPLPKIFFSCPHFPCSLRRFCYTAGQSSSVEEIVRPKYLNKETVVSGAPYAKKTRPIFSSVSSTRKIFHLISVLRQHISEFGCARLSDSCGIYMPHWGHRGWGWSPSYRMTMLYQECW